LLKDFLQIQGLVELLDESPVFEIANNTLILPQLIKQYSEETIIFQIIGVVNVGYFVEDATFEIRIKDTNNNIIAIQLNNIPYETTPLPINQINVEVSDFEINKRVDYTFSFYLEPSLNSGMTYCYHFS